MSNEIRAAMESGEMAEALAELKAAKEKMAAVGKKAVDSALKKFLGRYPVVSALRWTQYTPYFNDGDECVFSVHDLKFRFNATLPPLVMEDDIVEYNDGFSEIWTYRVLERRGKQAKFKAGIDPDSTAAKFVKDADGLNDLMKEAQDALRVAFGDHVRVTLERDADSFVVEEYEHD